MKKPEEKTEVIRFRCTKKEKNRIESLARKYARGNVSQWLRYSSLSVDRKFLKYYESVFF